MNTRKTIGLLAALVALTGVAALAAPGQDATQFLKGKVINRTDTSLSLEKRVDAVRDDFRRTKTGDLVLIGYVFPSRSTIHHHDGGLGGPFEVTVEDGELEFRGRSDSQSFESQDRGGPAGLLLLHSLSKPQSKILSARLIDTRESYEFKKVPVYWLGSVDAESSFGLLEKEFERGGEDLRKTLIFILSEHNTPRTFDFLKRVAQGVPYGLEVRKDAVFWIGNSRDPRGLGLLKEVFRGAREQELKEQVVFALTLNDRQDSLAELIRIAKTEEDLEVRKNAIFWLGQKASQESIRTLTDFVEKPDEEVEVKESAIFAISQLPQDKAVPLLVSIARENKSPAVRKKAMFWLGQTGDAQALKLFEEILLKK